MGTSRCLLLKTPIPWEETFLQPVLALMLTVYLGSMVVKAPVLSVLALLTCLSAGVDSSFFLIDFYTEASAIMASHVQGFLPAFHFTVSCLEGEPHSVVSLCFC